MQASKSDNCDSSFHSSLATNAESEVKDYKQQLICEGTGSEEKAWEEGERKDTRGSFANTKQICLWVLCFTVILSLHSQ